MEPNESSSYSDNRKYFQILEIQRKEKVLKWIRRGEIAIQKIKECDNIFYKSKEEKEAFCRMVFLKNNLPGNPVNLQQNTEIHGQARTRKYRDGLKLRK